MASVQKGRVVGTSTKKRAKIPKLSASTLKQFCIMGACKIVFYMDSLEWSVYKLKISL